MNLEWAKHNFGNKDAILTLDCCDKDQNTILIQTVVEIDPESPLDAVNAYREETAEDVDIYTLAWRGRRFTEEDEEELA